MTSIKTPDDLLAGAVNGQRTPFQKTPIESNAFTAGIAAAAAGTYFSYWTVVGGTVEAGAVPSTTAATCSSATAGAYPLTDASAGEQLFLFRFSPLLHGSASNGGEADLILFDRLAHVGGLNANITTLQTVNVSLPSSRPDTTGEGVELWLEIYTTIGANPQTLTISYVDESNASVTTTWTSAASAQARRCFQIQPAAGSFGFRSITSVQFISAGTGTAGNFGLTLVRRITHSLQSGPGTQEDAGPFRSGFPRIYDSSCLFVVVAPTQTAVIPDIVVDVCIAESGQSTSGFTQDDVVTATNWRQPQPFIKDTVSGGSGNSALLSSWSSQGVNWCDGTAPAASAQCTSATPGALTLADATGGRTMRLLSLSIAFGIQGAGTGGPVMFLDRLVHHGSFDANSTSLQSTSGVSLPDRGGTTGEGVMAYVEITATFGGTARDATVSYKDQDDNSSTTTVRLPANAITGRFLPIPLEAGDRGIRSIESIQLSVGGTGAGTFSIVMVRMIAVTQMTVGATLTSRGPFELGLPRVYDGACIMMATHSSSVTWDAAYGEMVFGEFGGTPPNLGTMSAVHTALQTRRQTFSVNKTAPTANQTTFALASYWLSAGLPAAGANPGAAKTMSSADLGSLPYNNASGGRSLRIGNIVSRLAPGTSTAGSAVHLLVDWLVAHSGCSGTDIASQPINTPAIPNRHGTPSTNGVGVWWFIVCFGQTGSTSVTCTITYTDNAGNNGQTCTVTIPATMRIGRMVPIFPATGDYGIKSIESLILSASTLTAGNFGVVCIRPIAFVGPNADASWRSGPLDLLLPVVPDSCCLVNHAASSVATDVHAEVVLIEG